MQKIISKNTLSPSPVFTLNELYKEGKVYVMDNHMAAAWCWAREIDATERYNLFHIDRHYDLLDSLNDFFVEQLNSQHFDFSNVSIEEYTSICHERFENLPGQQIFRYDNYITLFEKFHPAIFVEKKFATHNDGTIPDSWKDMYEVPFYDLHSNLVHWISQTAQKWIVNIDIDYFFSANAEGEKYQVFSDQYIIEVGQEIAEVLDKIKVISIALSPTFCGGIQNSKRVARLILQNILGRDIDL